MPTGLDDAVIVLTREGMGEGPAELQQRLLQTYLQMLLENGIRPGAVCFYTEGVKLLVEGSAMLQPLRALEAQGVRLIVCRTCLDYWGLTDRVRVGIVGGMGDIQAAMVKAAKVLTL